MSIPDRIHSAAIRQAIDVSRYEAGLRARVLGLLDQLGKDLVKELAGSGLDTPRTDWQRARLRDLLKLAGRRITEVYGEVDRLTSEEYRGLVEISSEQIVTRINGAIGANLLQPLNWSERQIAAIADEHLVFGAKSGEWWSRQAADLAQAFGDQMRMGLLRGESLGQLVKRVRGIDGLMGTSRRNAEAMVRSSVISLNNEAHLATFAENADIMEGIEWTATLDKRTCPRCAVLDGLRWDMNRQPIGHDRQFPGPVLHWSDRCTQIPVTKSWEELLKNKKLGRELDKIPRGDRASMGGPVKGDTTYEGWFKGLTPTTQRDILGDKKYDLWKRSGLSFSEMVSQDGHVLTLAELRAL